MGTLWNSDLFLRQLFKFFINHVFKNPSSYLTFKIKDSFHIYNSYVYLVKIYDDMEVFFKFGIASNGIDRRFSEKSLNGYSFEIVDSIESNWYDATYIEKNNINMFEKYVGCDLFSYRAARVDGVVQRLYPFKTPAPKRPTSIPPAPWFVVVVVSVSVVVDIVL